MTQVPLSPFDASDAQDQVLAFSNLLSAYYSIPLIESIYENGFSIDQLRRLKTVFEILISANRHFDAFMLFISLYQHLFKKSPIALYALTRFPIAIPLFLFEFLEDFDSLLDEFSIDEIK